MSHIEARELGAATETVAVNGKARARVVAVRNRNEIRVQTGWVSQDAFSAAIKMSREQAEALRDALASALD